MRNLKNYSYVMVSSLFTLFAALQYNDPDKEVWISIYMCAAIMPLLHMYNLLSKTVIVTALLLNVAGAIYVWPVKYQGILMPMQHNIQIEQARESFGLLICAASAAWLLFLSYRKKVVAI